MRRGGTTVQNVEHTTLLLIKIEEERNLFVNTKIIAIIGRSGSGKSTLAKELAIDLNANIIKSFTTRDLRDEYDDHTQSTHQQYEIDKNNNKAIAIYESKYGHVYWSTTDQVVQNMVNIYVIDYKGLIQLRNFYKEMDILCSEKVSDEELDMVRNYMLGDMCRSYESAFSLSDAWIFIETSGLKNDFFDHTLKAIREVTSDELQALAQKYFCKENLIAVVAGKKV